MSHCVRLCINCLFHRGWSTLQDRGHRIRCASVFPVPQQVTTGLWGVEAMAGRCSQNTGTSRRRKGSSQELSERRGRCKQDQEGQKASRRSRSQNVVTGRETGTGRKSSYKSLAQGIMKIKWPGGFKTNEAKKHIPCNCQWKETRHYNNIHETNLIQGIQGNRLPMQTIHGEDTRDRKPDAPSRVSNGHKEKWTRLQLNVHFTTLIPENDRWIR